MQRSKQIIHEFTIGDVEDPNQMASFIIEAWLKDTPRGQFIQKVDPAITVSWEWDELGLSYKYKLVAYIEERQYTLFSLLGD